MMNLLDFDRQGLIDFFAQWGEKPFRATQLLQWVHQQGVSDISQMTNISKALRQRLHDETCVKVPSIVTVQHSNDGTRKWLLQLDDGNCIETVFIPEDDRGTLCVSSQVGCALNCSFCATAQQGFNRNLTLAEIIGQLWIAEHSLRAEGTHKINPMSERIISNVVFMGMGEPLANFNTVVQAIKVMMDDYGYGMSWRRVTVSTAGMVSGIAKLREQCPVHLAISLHATTDALRDELVPLNKKYPIAELLEACRGYVAEDTRRRITFEYVMLKDVNDSLEDARALVKLLRNVPSKVNLIPFNPFPHTQYQRSTPEQIDRFRELLWKGGLVTVTRKTRGDDIDAACGQLAGKVQDRSRRHLKLKNIPILQQGIL